MSRVVGAVPLTVFTLDYMVRYPACSVTDVAAKVRPGRGKLLGFQSTCQACLHVLVVTTICPGHRQVMVATEGVEYYPDGDEKESRLRPSKQCISPNPG